MKVSRFSFGAEAVKLFPYRFIPVSRMVPYTAIESVGHTDVADGRYCHIQLGIFPGERLTLTFHSLQAAEAFSSEMTAILAPAVLTGPTILEPAELAETARELVQSRGLNIRKTLDFLIRQGTNQGASDIFLEFSSQGFEIKYKIDGTIFTVVTLPVEIGARIINSLKTAAGMVVYRSDTIQEGRMSIPGGGGGQDVRVSIIPTGSGERGVIRLFDRLKGEVGLDEMGFTPPLLHLIREALASTGGLMVICGPSGSGKTTTAYALLRELVASQGALGSIITVEDPIEFRIDGISQIEVDGVAEVSFASAISSILRQDPSVIMIGEIRDAETADAAITAALTGHLVITTLHAGSAAEAITRLLDLGVRPVLVASALKLIISQRLIRRLCPHCSIRLGPAGGDEERNDTSPSQRGNGCRPCRMTGFSGRLAIAELLPVSQAVAALIANGRSDTSEIANAAVALGMIPLRQAGTEMAGRGITELQEIARVTG